MVSSAAESTSVPWDTSTGNRFAYYFSEDHSAPLWIAAALSFTYVLGMLLVRLYLKWRVFGWDDFLILFSTVRYLILRVDGYADSEGSFSSAERSDFQGAQYGSRESSCASDGYRACWKGQQNLPCLW